MKRGNERRGGRWWHLADKKDSKRMPPPPPWQNAGKGAEAGRTQESREGQKKKKPHPNLLLPAQSLPYMPPTLRATRKTKRAHVAEGGEEIIEVCN